MSKPKIFISYISEEARLAQLIKTRLASDFLGMLDVFAYSDPDDNPVGRKWLMAVEDALKGAQIELVLCSRYSVNRPWVNFEAGSGWAREIPIVPICHTDMHPVDLPIPLNMLQGISASDQAGWEKVYQLVASSLGSTVPSGTFTTFLTDILTLEKEYQIQRGSDLKEWRRSGNVFWLGQDLCWAGHLIEVIAPNSPSRTVVHALNQALHHLREIDLAGTVEEKRLVQLISKISAADFTFTPDQKQELVPEVRGLIGRLGALAESTQPGYRPNP